jgi:glycosyltransferase involved in cell wall biosynthesis
VRILYVLEHFYPYTGGAELLFYHLTTSLAELGHEVKVITTKFDKNLPSEETYQGVKIHRISCKNRYFFTFLALPAVVKHAAWADLIHTTSYNAGFPASLGGLFRKKKVVITFHEVWRELWWSLPFIPLAFRPIYFGVEWALLKMPFSHWIAVSKSTKQALERNGIPAKKISLIYNGIDYSHYKNAYLRLKDGGKFQFLYFGRQGVSKGVDLIIPAFEELVKSYPQVQLQLVLSNRPNQISRWIKSKIKDIQSLKNQITTTYDLPKQALKEAIANADAVLIPSYSEGFCFAAVETVALGTPLISSGRGALSEVVGGKVIVMEEFSVAGLKSAMELALKEKWQELPVQRFELATFIEKHMLFYVDLKKN